MEFMIPGQDPGNIRARPGQDPGKRKNKDWGKIAGSTCLFLTVNQLFAKNKDLALVDLFNIHFLSVYSFYWT